MTRLNDLHSFARRAAATVVAASVFSLGAVAQEGGQAPNQGQAAQQQNTEQAQAESQSGEDKSEKEEKEKKKTQSLKVFKLEQADPQQVAQLLRSLDQPGQMVMAGFRGVPGGFAPAGSPDYQQEHRPLLIAADTRGKKLFVRGDSERLEEIEKIVSALDGGEDVETLSLGDARVIPLRHARHQEVTSVLQQLQLPATAQQIGERSVVIIRGDDEDQIAQAEEVVNALDEQAEERADDAEAEKQDAEDNAEDNADNENGDN